MNYRLKDLLDIPKLQDLLDSLDELHSLPSAVIDREGTILTATAWQEICTRFHRVNPETEKKCTESDLHIEAVLDEKLQQVIYRCPMGLVDTATPIIVEGRHLGTVTTGQFFLEPPDEEYFKKQAAQYGFDEGEYLAAVRKVPVIARDRLLNNLTFIGKLAQMLTEQGLQNKRQNEAEQALAEREALYRDLFAGAKDGILILSLDGRLIEVNESFAEMHGYTPEEMKQMRLADLDTAETFRMASERKQRLLAGETLAFEVEHYHKDGHIFRLEVSSSMICSGGHSYIQGFHRDITERTEAEKELFLREQALAGSERFLKTIIDTEPECIKMLDAGGNLLMMNQAGLDMIEADSFEQVKGHCVYPLVIPPGRDAFMALTGQVFQGTPGKLEFEITGLKGGHAWLETHAVPFRNDQGEIVALLGITRNITELKRAEEIFRIVFSSAPIGLILTDSRSVVLDCNRHFAEMFGAVREAYLGMNLLNVMAPGPVRQNLADAIADGRMHQYEGPYVSIVSGKMIDISISTEMVAPDLFITLIMDISERMRAEAQLKTSEENYRSLTGLTSDYVHKCVRKGDAPFRLQWIGGSVGAISGYTAEEVLKMGCWMPLVHPDDRQDVTAYLLSLSPGDSTQKDFRIITKDGQIRWISETSRCEAGKADGELILFGAAKDITERMIAEEERDNLSKQILHAQKLESLGVLAGGIAHDFNNLLTSIVGNADLALMRMNPESPAIDNLHNIEHAAGRAADLARQMLAYSGKGKFLIETLDINRLLKEMLHLLEVSISKKVELLLNLAPDLPAVEADATQIQQIIMNLVINASEAIGDRNGVITIATAAIDCNKRYLQGFWLDEDISPGMYVCLEITDTGCGMGKETLNRIFDPFFTTKFTGRGLGMAAVHGIIRGHKGAINVYSEPGKGSSLKVLLPASVKPVAAVKTDSKHEDWKSEGKVLLVDDEETVREVGTELLQELGFTVITANNGNEALELFNENPDIAFVVLDLTMPQMDGEQCFHELRQIKPDVKVIISSGFSEHEVIQKFTGKGLAGFIQKPYKLSMLIDAVEKLTVS